MAILTVTTINDSGVGSLRTAIATAQSGDTIQFAPELAQQTITLTSGPLTIAAGKNLTIDGAGATNLTLSGNATTRILQVDSNGGAATNLTLKNLTLSNGYTATRGGAINAEYRAGVTVENVTFTNNVADQGGGAIFVATEGNLTVANSRFNGNQAIAANDERGAGAIAFIGPGALTVQNSDFIGNRGINGAAINSLNAKTLIENSRFLNNDTNAATFATGQPNDFLRGYGGAIYTDRGNDTITIRNSVFEGNSSRAAGGAIHLFADPEDVVTVESTLFRNNQATGLPGGEDGNAGAFTHIRNSLDPNGRLIINNSAFVDNTAGNQGGGLWMNNTQTTITNTTFSGNKTLGTDFNRVGGGLALYGPTEIINTTIANNQAGWSGGGIAASGEATVSLKNTIITNNTAQNPWNIQQQTNRALIDNGGNLQWPPKGTDLGNDTNATATITLADPLLGFLQTQGGTVFYPLLPGSPAINTGAISGVPTTDQLGLTRDGQPDSGAVEFGAAPAPGSSLSPQAITVAESSDAGTFTVALSAPSTQLVSVDYATADGTATAGTDYTAVSGTLQFNPGETSQTIAVPILNDALVEGDETFLLNFTNPVNAVLLANQAVGTIQDDDQVALPSLTINPVSLSEGDSGTTNAIFTVSLSSPSSQPVTVDYATADGSAIAGTDYTATNGTLTFNVGDTTQTFNVPVQGDALVEPDETFTVNLSAPNQATLATAQAIGTIVNDDLGSQPAPLSPRSDFNSDGQPDILWHDPSSGETQVWLMNNLSVSTTVALPTNDVSWKLQGVGDFNGDRQPDLLWRHEPTDQTGIWQMNGTAISVVAYLPSTGDANWTVQAINDFTSDGKADVLWHHTSNGSTRLWQLESVTAPSAPLGSIAIGSATITAVDLPALPGSTWQALA